jgi:hypothetical protein
MVTSRKSKKFHNLSENPSASLLIDTREEDSASQNPKTRALTIAGVYTQLADENKKSKIRSEMVSKHPAIRDLIKNPNAEILCIKIVSFLLLNGPTEAHFERLV